MQHGNLRHVCDDHATVVLEEGVVQLGVSAVLAENGTTT